MVAGGGQAIADVEAYDPATDTWEQKKLKMLTATANHATAVVRGKIYTFGGIDKAGEILARNNVQEYTADGWPFAVSPQGKLATAWGRMKAAD